MLFDSELSRRTLTLLALSSAVYMVALALAQAIIALRGHAWVALGWGAGMAAFVLVTAVAGDDLLLRVELGLIAGSLAALRRVRHRRLGTARCRCAARRGLPRGGDP